MDSELALVFVEGITAGSLELVEQLVVANDIGPDKLNQNVDEIGTVLHITARHGHADILEFLLEHGADVNKLSPNDYATPLHEAVGAGHVEVTKALLCKGASPNVRTRGLYPRVHEERCAATPLHIAADSGNVDIIQELLDHGAQIDGHDKWNFHTPLLFAVRQGHERAAALLLSRGAAPDGDYRAKSSPLTLAAYGNDEAIVTLLLDAGADVNRRDQDGDPAIHTAAFCGYENIVRLLLKKRVNTIDLIGGSGRPSWWFAAKNGHEKIKSLLEQQFTNQKPKYGKSETQPVQYPPDLIDDFCQPFRNFPEGAFVRDIEKAQGFIYSMMDERESWKERLRFVIPAPADAGEYDIELIEPYRKDEIERSHKQNEEPDEPYIAISYCWSTHATNTDKPLRIKIPGKDRGNYTIRETFARPEVLHRSLALAKAKGIRRIWIDQECIHQHDPDDKRALIGVMHQIYSMADITLVVLGRHVQSAEEIRGLKDLCDPKRSEELRDRIFEDRWFSRAWTAQEYINATKSKLVYLVGWASDLDSSGELWKEVAVTAKADQSIPKQTIPREWELSSDALLSMSFMTMGHGNEMNKTIIKFQTDLDDNFTLCSPDLDKMPWWQTGSNNKETSHAKQAHECSTRYDHHLMAMISAVTILWAKRNLLISDRVSILANLTRYPFHLDMKQLLRKDDERHSLGFTACIIALALYNGDLSLILDHPFPPSTSPDSNLPTWLPPADMSFSSLVNRGMPLNAFRGKTKSFSNPSFVVNGKLLTRGILWEITPFTGLLTLQNEVANFLRICRTWPSRQIEGVGLTLLKMVGRRLVECNQKDLLELVLTEARSDQLSSPAELVSTISAVEAWAVAKWPVQVTVSKESGTVDRNKELTALRLQSPEVSGGDGQGKETGNTAPFADLADNLVEQIPTEWGSDILRWIFYTIYVGASLPVGQCCTGDSPLFGIFKIPGSHVKKVLVPTSDLNYEFGSNWLLSTVTSRPFWCVSETEDEASDEDLEVASRRLAAAKCEHGCISKKILKINGAVGTHAVWSPRLSSQGVLKQNDGSQPWEMTSLGRAADYHFIA